MTGVLAGTGLSVCLCPPVRGGDGFSSPSSVGGQWRGAAPGPTSVLARHLSPQAGPSPMCPTLAWGERAFTPRDLGQAFKP